MAGWMALLKLVPWTDVISAAPQVAGGARRLWDAVATKAPAEQAEAAAPGGISELETLRLRLDKSDAALADLHGQMLSASEIIAKLADQNAQLIAKVEAMRVRLLWLGAGAGAGALLALIALIVALR